MKRIEIFKVSRHYVSATIYVADDKTHELIGRSTVTPDKGLTREVRRNIIKTWLAKNGFKLPENPNDH